MLKTRACLVIHIFILLVLTQQSCGYQVVTKNRTNPQFQKLVIPSLENETKVFEVEQILTQSLVRAFIERTSFDVVNEPSEADAVLEGAVSQVIVNPVLYGEQTFGSTFLVTISVRVKVVDRKTGNIFYENDNHVFRDQYVINVDVENFFSELNPALERIGQDFADSVVVGILEGF